MPYFLKTLTSLALGLALITPTAHADTLAEIKARKKVLIGVDMGTPPFGMLDEKMQPQGSEIETARTIAKDLGVELELVQVTGPNRMSYLLAKKIDLSVSVLSITPERRKSISFSKPYGALEFVVAAPKSSNINKLEDLAGKKVAVTRGNIQDLRLTPIAPKGTTIVRFEDDATAATALLSGQVDALCTPNAISNVLSKQYPARQIENKFSIAATAYAVGLRKGDTTLNQWLDNWVDANRQNGKLAAIYKQWIGSELPELSQFDHE
jgi:polar amino acid transport system substrate-binding protein